MINIPKELLSKIQSQLHAKDILALLCTCSLFNNQNSDTEYHKIYLMSHLNLLGLNYSEGSIFIPQLSYNDISLEIKVNYVRKFVYQTPAKFNIDISGIHKTGDTQLIYERLSTAWAIPLFLLLKWAKLTIPNFVKNNPNAYIGYIREGNTFDTLIDFKKYIENEDMIKFSFFGIDSVLDKIILHKQLAYIVYTSDIKTDTIKYKFDDLFGKIIIPSSISQQDKKNTSIYTAYIYKNINNKNINNKNINDSTLTDNPETIFDKTTNRIFFSTLNAEESYKNILKTGITNSYCDRYIN